jgi:uncharacterized protein (TIGR01777 family)
VIGLERVRVTITGATGTIGRALVGELTARGDEVTALSRDPATANLEVETLGWPDPKKELPPAGAFHGRDAVVHLLGETLAQRWSDQAKREIRDSRVIATRNLLAALATLPEENRPRTLVSQSAVGWYGPRGSERIDEDQPPGSDFLATVVRDWEAEARKAPGMRVVVTRTGVVLAPRGGALAKMLPFFKLGIGGPVAGGSQYVPWVHLDDVVGAILFCLDTEAVRGHVNVTAPEPVANKEFSRTLGRVLRRPAFAPVPGLAVKALYGEMAMVVTTGQRVVPGRLMELGYEFREPDLEAALRRSV